MSQNIATMKNAVVVGGSLTGLMAAIALREQGFEVRVLERSTPEDLQSQAAGMRAGPEVVSFIERYVKSPSEYCIPIGSVEYLNKHGETLVKQPISPPMPSTTWYALYKLFKKEFLTRNAGKPDVLYRTGQRVEGVREEGDAMIVTYRDGDDETLNELKTNLVIGADGANSAVRSIFSPDQRSQYAGYVTWRGRVEESAVEEATRERLQNQIVLQRANGEYFLTYYVKADEKADTSRPREFVWIWYTFLPGDSHDYYEAMTDVNGKRHFSTIPRGKVRPGVWAKKLAEAHDVANPMFTELLEKTAEPFLSAIRDFPPIKSIFCEGKVILLGDALALARPHSGASTSSAALQVLHLAKVLDGAMSLEQWEQEMIEKAKEAYTRSIAMGEFFFTGKMNPAAQSIIRENSSM